MAILITNFKIFISFTIQDKKNTEIIFVKDIVEMKGKTTMNKPNFIRNEFISGRWWHGGVAAR